MDYESEDEQGDNEAEENDDEGEAEVEENAEAHSTEESQPESSGMRLEARKKQKKKVTKESELQMRVNSVLDLNSAIEGYRFDQQDELWCEVSLKLRSR